jgi:photosystem II stability/assembly factor-like uncharacterized protein
MKIEKNTLQTIRRIFIYSSYLYAITLMSCQTANVNSQSTKNSNGRNDEWGYVGMGGGGAMFNPTVSPHNPSNAFVSCDMGGSFSTINGGETWRMFNLHGMVKYYVFDPNDSNVVYANSLALFKSIDRGNTWNLFYPSVSEVKGLVSKGDHAEEVLMTRDSSDRNVLAMAVDPSDSKKLYAVIAINKSSAFYVSSDGGNHWTLEKKLNDGVRNIFIDPSSPKENRTIFVAGNYGIDQRINGIWQKNKLPVGVKKITTYSGGYDAKQGKVILYAISGKSYFNSDEDQLGIFFSDNGGQSWQNRQDGILKFCFRGTEVPEWRAIGTSALHPNVVYVSYNGLQVHPDSTCIGVAKSEDFGKTWKLVWKDILIKGKQIPSSNFARDMLNERYGPSWGENPFGLGVAPTHPEICFATDFGRTVKTSDGGKTWEQAYSKSTNGVSWSSRGLEVTTGYNIVFDPFDRNHVFIAITDVGLFESNDGTQSWTSATKNNGIPEKWVNSCYWITFDSEVKGKAWAVMSPVHDLPRPKMFRKRGTADFKGGVLMTENGGKTWQPVSKDIGEAAMTHILYDPKSDKQSRILYACGFGKGVYKSVDGGKSWLQKNRGIESKEPFAWRIERRENDGALFLIVSRRGEDGSIGSDTDGALYKSIDGAENWTRVALPAETNAPTSLVIDPQHPQKILLSAWGRKTSGKYTPEIGGGIFLSEDDGKSWKQVLTKDQHIHDLTFDNQANRYYACGFNGSAYYSEDGGNSWNRIKGYNFKWGKRVVPDPANRQKIFIVTFGGGIWHGPANGDPKAAEDIVTPLPSF